MWEKFILALIKYSPDAFESFLRKMVKKKKISELNILFIDDEHDELDIIKTLNQSKEYWNVDSIEDLDNLNNLYLKNADIIFLDVQWVWKKMKLKDWTSMVDRIICKYPEKIITIYSSKWLPKNSHYKAGVATIPKNSSYETFSSHIKTLWDSKK